MLIPFKELSSLITRCCQVVNKNSEAEFKDRHEFVIDMHKLETIFRGRNLDYHIIALTTNLPSYVPYATDIHFLSQFVKDTTELANLVDGNTQVAVFAIFSDKNYNGNVDICNTNEETPMPAKELFNKCNKEDELDLALVSQLEIEVPTYTILVYRKFNGGRDRFTYNVKYIANKEMTKYYKSCEEHLKEAETKKEEKKK